MAVTQRDVSQRRGSLGAWQGNFDSTGATHHVTARGNNRKRIFRSNRDREKFIEYLGEAVRRYGWVLTSWTLMTNHFHSVIETPEPTLSAGMQWLLEG